MVKRAVECDQRLERQLAQDRKAIDVVYYNIHTDFHTNLQIQGLMSVSLEDEEYT